MSSPTYTNTPSCEVTPAYNSSLGHGARMMSSKYTKAASCEESGVPAYTGNLGHVARMTTSTFTSNPSCGTADNGLDYRTLFEKERQEKEVRRSTERRYFY